MNRELKEAALSMMALMAMTTEEEIIKSPARFYGMVCDFLNESRFEKAKLLIKKGLDSGVYVEILKKSGNRDIEAQKAVVKLMDSELMTEAHAREIVGLWLIALNPEIEHSLSVEEWVDECANEQLADSTADTTSQPSADTYENTKKSQAASEIEPLLKRVFIFLEEKNWTSALQYAERVLDKDPECSKAYLGKLMAELKVSKEILLCEASTPQISIKENFKRACKYATAEELKVLKDYEYRNAYAHGKQVMGWAKTEKNFKDAASWFALYPTYKDSKALYDECMKKAEAARREALYQKALSLPLEKQASAFSAISGYKDADARRQQALASLEEKRAREQERIERARRLKIISVVIVIAALVIDFVLTLSLKDVSSICRWLWLPLIALGISVIVTPLLKAWSDDWNVEEWVCSLWMIGSSIWGIIRGIIIVVADFAAVSGWDILGPIFLCLFMFAFNSCSYLIAAIWSSS